MTISAIYERYALPLNLQQHMLRTAALGQLLAENILVPVHTDLVVSTLLLHDLGNLLKFDFGRPDLFEPADRPNIPHYQQAQTEMRKKYGPDPDQATYQMIWEVTKNKAVVELCQESDWRKAAEYTYTEEWEKKIVRHADMRIGPFGILSLSERFADLMERRPEEKDELVILFELGRQIQEQLQAKVEIDLDQIDPVQIESLATFKNFSQEFF